VNGPSAVRQLVERHALLVQKPAKVEAESDGANVRDAETIANQRVRRAAARNPFNAVRAAVLEDVPNNEEVFFIADCADDLQFLFDLRAHGGCAFAVTSAQSIRDELVKELVRRRTVRWDERGKLRFAEWNFKLAAVSNFERVCQPFGMVLAGHRHFCRRAEMKPSIRAFGRMFLPEQCQCADGLHDVVFQPVGGRGVMNRRTCDNGELPLRVRWGE